MGNFSKNFTIVLILMTAISSLSLMTTKFASAQSAQSIPMPSVPQFTLKYADHSYDVSPKTTTSSTTNPYNGNTTTTTTTTQGYHVRNFTIDVTIENQPFTSINIDGNSTGLYYNVRIKGHFGEDWMQQYSYTNQYSSIGGNVLPYESRSKYTVLSIPANDYQAGDQVDFQVQAVIGYSYISYDYSHPPQVFSGNQFVYNSSDWSSTQTVTIPASSNSASPTSTLSPTPTITPTSTVPEFSAISVLAIFLVLSLFAVTMLTIRKRKITKT